MKKVLFLLLPLFLILNVGCSSDDPEEIESSNYPVCKNDIVWYTLTDSPGEVIFNTCLLYTSDAADDSTVV